MVLGKKKDKEQQENPSDLIARKEYKKAIEILRERISKQPKNSNLRLNLADALFASNQNDQAVTAYKDLASLYTEEGFLVKAIAIYKKVLKISPSLKDVEQLLANL